MGSPGLSGENYLLLRPGQLAVTPPVSQKSHGVQLQQLQWEQGKQAVWPGGGDRLPVAM